MGTIFRIIIGLFVAVGGGILINKSTEAGGFDWIKRHLRITWVIYLIILSILLFSDPNILRYTMQSNEKLGARLGYIICFVLGGLLLCGYWYFAGKISKSAEKKSEQAVKIGQPKEQTSESPKIKTLRELFLTDFKKTHILGEYHLNTKQAEVYTIEYIIWCDFDTKTKYLSIFLPKSDRYTLDACRFLIARYKEIVNGNIRSLMEGMIHHAPGEKEESYDELKFSGRIYIYHETELLSKHIDSLKEEYKKVGLSPQFRGRDYLLMKTSPLYEEVTTGKKDKRDNHPVNN